MDKLDFAFQVLVIGFSVVMVALLALYFLLILFAKLFHKDEQKKSVPGSLPSADLPAAGLKDDRRLAAAITAAVYQYMGQDQSDSARGRFSITVQPAGSAVTDQWQIMGRRMLLQNSTKLQTIRRHQDRENI